MEVKAMHALTFKQLQGFVQLNRRRSYTLAAADIGITQSALTLLIQTLERTIGTALIVRKSRPLKLTEAGSRFLPLSERILEDVDLAAAVGSVSAHSRLTIATLPTLAATLLPKIVVEFRNQYPHVAVQIRDALTEDIIARVRSGDAHFGLGAFLGYDDDLTLLPLFSDRLVALAAPTTFKRTPRLLTWTRLAQHPTIQMSRDSNIRKLTDLAFFQHGIDVRPAFETQLVSTAVAFVRAGLGIAVIPALEAYSLHDRALRVIPLGGPIMRRDIGLLMRRGLAMTSTVERFINLVKQQRPGTDRFQRRAVWS
jgi:LysR family transcriptional regulator, carnitine catabolism transcriptional activator